MTAIAALDDEHDRAVVVVECVAAAMVVVVNR
jgi:hypothetical protein